MEWTSEYHGTAREFVTGTTDGSFRIDNVRDSEYLIAVNGIPSGLYLKRAESAARICWQHPSFFQQMRAATSKWCWGRILPGSREELSMRKAARPSPPRWFLVPVQRLRNDLYKPTSTDLNGSFTISGIAPGEYRLFSWDAIEPFSYFDPDFIKVYESQAQLIHLDEGSAPTVDFKIMPLVD